MVTLVVSCTVFEILLHKGWKIAFLPYLPCFEAPARGTPSEFLDETYPAETRGMGILYGENCIILTSNAFDWSTRVTDGQTELRWHIRAIAYMLSRVKTRKVKPIWIYWNKREWVAGWQQHQLGHMQIRTWPRHITMPASHHILQYHYNMT